MALAAGSARPLLPTWHPVEDGYRAPHVRTRARRAVTAVTDAEAHLVRTAQSGDREAFEQLVRQHADRLYAVVIRVVGDRHEAEEVVQETFLRAWRSLGTFEGRSQFFTWLYRIGVNEAKRTYERRGARPASTPLEEAPGQAADERHTPHARAEAQDLRQALEAAIIELPMDHRMPLVLRDIEGLSTAEAAEVMDLGEAAFKSRLHRARLAVRAAVEELVTEEDDA
jgi:RNA polymerase sigma-70 factor (ECF subfamily)